jgi:DNA-binding transcriptional MerR regulator
MESETQREYSIGELADRAGVSTRTIRYYVSEGLLPPPVAAGPNSRYTDVHLERLGAINHLKEQYLPLKEIRRRLIDPDLPEVQYDRQADAPPSPSAHSIGSAYSVGFASGGRPSAADIKPPPPMAKELVDQSGARNFVRRPPQPTPASAPVHRDSTGENWRRITVADGAELLIKERQYERHRDKIDWLVQWAARVLE